MSRRTYAVSGMTCGHCARFVTEAVERIPHVTAVVVDVEGGRVTVTRDGEPDDEAVRAAVDDAGYEVTLVHRE